MPQLSAAVPPGAVSFTAKATCELRAIAARAPDPKLRNDDVLAERLCDPVRLPRDYESARAIIDGDPVAYASYFYVDARTKHIDAAVQRALRDGIRQIVVMGAGFDSRAYRFRTARSRTPAPRPRSKR